MTATVAPFLPPCPNPLPRCPRRQRMASVNPAHGKFNGSPPMATAVVDIPAIEQPSWRSREHQIFWGMSVLIALVVFIGFARTYFLAGFFHAKPFPAPIIHVHGMVFTSWIALLVIQASLAANRRADIHRRLGIVGFVLAPFVLVLGILVAHEMLSRLWAVPGFDARAIYAVALSEALGFAVPVAFALRL